MQKKLVPIDADLAGACAAAGKKNGRGYYATVNDRLRQHSQMVHAAPVVLLVAAVTETLPDLAHYVATHGPGPDRRLDELRRALNFAQDALQGVAPVTSAADCLQRIIDEIDGGDATLDELRRMAANTLQASTPPATAGAWCVAMLRDMGAEFPGLLNGDDDVNGGDLVDFMNGHADDPFEAFDEGEFFQFDPHYKHYVPRPDCDEFKRIVRANPNRVFTHSGTGNNHGPGTTNCTIEAGPFSIRDTRFDAKGNRAGDSGRSITDDAVDDADGYYIVPEDAADSAKYAKGALKQYTEWCNGECYGIVIWVYHRDSIADEWGEPERDNETWGYYGRTSYTLEELREGFNRAASCFYHK